MSQENRAIFVNHLNVKINITKTMREFFGTNPFLYNLFNTDKENMDIFNNNTDKKATADPILDKLLQTYKTDDLENNDKHLKTIFSEGESSYYSINEENTSLQIPKMFFDNNRNNASEKRKSDINNKGETHSVINDNDFEKPNLREEKKSNFSPLKRSDPNQKKYQTFLKLNESSLKQSFAMNRRGEEFLKMPSLNILTNESPTLFFEKGVTMNESKKFDTKVKKEPSLIITSENYNEFALRQANMQETTVDQNVEDNFKMLVNYVNEDVSTWDKVSKSKFLEVHRRKVIRI